MSIKFQCPQCQKTLTAPDAAAGRRFKCPNCGSLNAVPAPQGGGPCCPNCQGSLPAHAVICVACGFDLRTGKKLSTDRRPVPEDEEDLITAAAKRRYRVMGRDRVSQRELDPQFVHAASEVEAREIAAERGILVDRVEELSVDERRVQTWSKQSKTQRLQETRAREASKREKKSAAPTGTVNLPAGSLAPRTGAYQCEGCGTGATARALAQQGVTQSQILKPRTQSHFREGQRFPSCPNCKTDKYDLTGWTLVEHDDRAPPA